MLFLERIWYTYDLVIRYVTVKRDTLDTILDILLFSFHVEFLL